jgi:hypothetical protein
VCGGVEEFKAPPTLDGKNPLYPNEPQSMSLRLMGGAVMPPPRAVRRKQGLLTENRGFELPVSNRAVAIGLSGPDRIAGC